MSNTQSPCINLVTTLSDGFYQSKKCQYYYGTCPELNVSRGRSGIVVLSNPDCSDKIVYLNSLTISNCSSGPIKIEVYSDTNIQKKLTTSCDISPGNTKCKCNNNNSCLDILYCNNITLNCGTKAYQRCIDRYCSSDGHPNGSIILCPGTERSYLITPLCGTESATALLSFQWWENDIC